MEKASRVLWKWKTKEQSVSLVFSIETKETPGVTSPPKFCHRHRSQEVMSVLLRELWSLRQLFRRPEA